MKKVKKVKMVCMNCFYGQNTYSKDPIYGRNTEGEEDYADEIFSTSVVCEVFPESKLVSKYDSFAVIDEEPEYHRCGQGKWWEDGKWISWIEGEKE
jgi:hypothetical protein